MRFPIVIHLPEVLQQKATLARRRSRLVWPDDDVPVKTHVRIEARIALRSSITENWGFYRRSSDPTLKAKFRSYMRAQITAFRILHLA